MENTESTTGRTDFEMRAEMEAAYVANRDHNRAAMDAAGVPQAARRGFTRATGWHAQRVTSIEPRDRAGRPRVWIVRVGDGFARSGWIVGPRGGATRAY